jgi:hypothetical protein
MSPWLSEGMGKLVPSESKLYRIGDPGQTADMPLSANATAIDSIGHKCHLQCGQQKTDDQKITEMGSMRYAIIIKAWYTIRYRPERGWHERRSCQKSRSNVGIRITFRLEVINNLHLEFYPG